MEATILFWVDGLGVLVCRVDFGLGMIAKFTPAISSINCELSIGSGLEPKVMETMVDRGNLLQPSVVNMLQFLNPRKRGIEGGANCAPSTEALSILEPEAPTLGPCTLPVSCGCS